MTQDQLAVSAQIDSSNVRAYETGRSTPSIQTLLRIAVAMRTPLAYFVEDLELEMFPQNADDGRRRRLK